MKTIDTNILVYSVDHDEPVKQPIAIDLLQQLVHSQSETVLLWQVAGEFLSCLRKWQSNGKISLHQVELYSRKVIDMFPLCIPTKSTLNISFDLMKRYSLSHWDCMLLASCIESGINTLFTEDLDKDTTYGSVKIINPFS